MLRHWYFILALLPAIISCETNEKNSAVSNHKKSDKAFTLKKLDSIQIYYLGNPTVHDLSPKTKKVLFVNFREHDMDVMVAGFDGSIISSFKQAVDTPYYPGSLYTSLKLEGDSSFVAYGSKGLSTYDLNGNLKSQVRAVDLHHYGPRVTGMSHGMEKVGDRYLLTNQNQPLWGYNDSRFYRDLKLFSWINTDTGDQEYFIQFPETGLFRSDKYFFRGAWLPVFTLANDLLYIVFGIEPVIYIYDTKPPYSLVSSIPINLPDYRYFKGADNYSAEDVRFFGHAKTSGKISNIKKIDNHFIISYFQGLNATETEISLSNLSPEESLSFWTRMRNKYPYRVAILDSLGNNISDFVPKNLSPSSMLLRNNELWMHEKPNPDIEKDYFTLYKVGLKSEPLAEE